MKLISEWWSELWPNVFAVSFWTIILFVWHHRSLKKHIDKRHDEMKEHVTKKVSSGN